MEVFTLAQQKILRKEFRNIIGIYQNILLQKRHLS